MKDAEKEVFRVVRDWKKLNGFDLWLADTPEKKKLTVKEYFRQQLYTLQVSPTGKLEGFLFFYRANKIKGFDFSRPYLHGQYVVVEVAWCKERNKIKKLIEKTMLEHWHKLAGAEKLVFVRGIRDERKRIYDFKSITKRFCPWGRSRATRNSSK